MKSWNEYTQTNKFIPLSESEILMTYGKEIDSINHKMGIYTNNHLRGIVNENANIVFSINERNAAAQLFTFVVNEYKKSLEDELYLIQEGAFDKLSSMKQSVVDWTKEKYNAGKETVQKAADSIKLKIEAVNKILKAIAKGAIKSVKDIFNTLLDIIDKVGGLFKNLIEKCGLDTDKVEKVWVSGAEEIAKKPNDVLKKIKDEKIYESFGNTLKNNKSIVVESLLLEDDENKEKTEGEKATDDSKTIKQGEEKGVKSALWQAFLGFARWFVVCVAIPGLVIGFFLGTFLALLVPLACKLAWNCYSMVKLCKQWQKVKKNWSSFKTWQQWLNAITIILILIGIVLNFKSLYDSAGPVIKAFAKNGFDLMAQAKLGIEPDMLQKGFGAIVKMLKEGKFSFDDLGQAYKEIGESFAKETNFVEKVAKVVKHGANMGKDIKEITNEVASKTWKSSEECIKWFQSQGIPLDKLPKDGIAKLVVDGHIDAAWGKKLLEFAAKSGDSEALKYAHHLNKVLNGMNVHAGSVMELEMPVKLLRKAMDAGIDIGYKNAFSVIGTAAEYTKDVVSTVTTTLEILSTMAITIPSVTVDVQNDSGFRVRLGGKDSGKYVYEVGEDGVKEELYSKTDKKHYKDLIDQNNKYRKQVKHDNTGDKDKKEKILKRCEEFDKKYKDAISKNKSIVLHGKLVDKGNEEEKKESYMSLDEYIINEGKKVTNSTIKDSLDSMINYFCNKIERSGKSSFLLDKDNKLRSNNNTDKEHQKSNNATAASNKLRKLLTTGKTDGIISKDNNVDLKGEQLLNSVFVPFAKILIATQIAFSKENLTGDAHKDQVKIATMLKEITSLYQTVKKENDSEGNNFDVKQEISDQQKAIYISITNLLHKDTVTEKAIKNKDIKIITFDNTDKTKTKEIEDKAKQLINKADDTDSEDKIVKAITNDDNDNKNEDNKEKKTDLTKDEDKDTPEESTEDTSDNGDIILVFSPLNVNGFDVAKSDKNGPRKDAYNFKGLYNSLEFMQIKGGLNTDQITELLGNILTDMVSKHLDCVMDKPCDENYKLNEKSGFAPDESRPDFGMLTNKEICDILNKKTDFEKIFNAKGGEISAAESPEEKEQLKEDTKTAKDKLKDNEELQQAIKDTDVLKSKYVDDDGNIDYDKLSSACAERKMAKKKSKGLWAKIKSFFGFGKDDDDYTTALDNLNGKLFESYEDIKPMLNEYITSSPYKRLSLSEYCKK